MLRIIDQCKVVADRVLGTNIAGRNCAVFPDNSFIVSYPRSGSTWLRFLVGNLLSPDQPISFKTVEQVLPDIHVNSTQYIKTYLDPAF